MGLHEGLGRGQCHLSRLTRGLQGMIGKLGLFSSLISDYSFLCHITEKPEQTQQDRLRRGVSSRLNQKSCPNSQLEQLNEHRQT